MGIQKERDKRSHFLATAVLLVLGGGLATGCTDDPMAPDTLWKTPGVGAILVTPENADAAIGDARRFRAEVVDTQGSVIEDAEVTWTSRTPDVAAVGAEGVVEALATGTATIEARFRGTTGEAVLVVRDEESSVATRPGLWIDAATIAALPRSGPGWRNVKAAADRSCPSFALSDQDNNHNTCLMAKALVYARTGEAGYRRDVVRGLRDLARMGTYRGRALALGRNLGAYAIAADLIDLRSVDPELDERLRATFRRLLTTPTHGAARHLIDCHERRPNNWGTHCGGARVAVAAYLEDERELERAANVFRGWLGDRSAYTGFEFGGSASNPDHSWECNRSRPVGINPRGCRKEGRNLDGVIPDDQRRGGRFRAERWPPTRELYVWEALQGALMQAVILEQAGYPAFEWGDQALLRAVTWLHDVARFPADRGNTWQPHIVNHEYGTSFPAPTGTRPGKNVGWTDWTHAR